MVRHISLFVFMSAIFSWAYAGTLSTGASVGQSSAKVAIRGVSKSVTSMSAGVSSTFDSSSKKSRAPIVLNFEKVVEPKLVKSYQSDMNLKFGPEIDAEDEAWLRTFMQDVRFPFFKGSELNVSISNHPTLVRRGRSARIIKGNLILSESCILDKNEDDLMRCLAEHTWSLMNLDEQTRWRQISGWTFLPIFPLIDTHTGSLSSESKIRGESAKRDFVELLLAYQSGKDLAETSRELFVRQLCGEVSLEVAEELESTKCYFAYIDEKGWAGASQGHCSIVIEQGEQRASFAFVADFDWEKPVWSATKALVGSAQRKIEIALYQDFVETYEAEGRVVKLHPLNLTLDQKNRLMFRLKELAFESGLKYSFLRQNCANPLRDVLAYSLGTSSKLSTWHTPKSLRNWVVKRPEYLKLDS